MNIILYSGLAIVGALAWWYSKPPLSRPWFWIGFGLMFVLWWMLWGRVAVADGWWVYTGQGVAFGHGGMVSLFDAIYFLGFGGWYFCACRKLGLF